MGHIRSTFGLAAALVVAVVTVSGAGAAEAPPPPKAVGGQAVTVVAGGVPTPTVFAFGQGQVFVGAFGDEENPKITGGVFVLRGGKAVKLAGSPAHVFGLAFDRGTLFVSAIPNGLIAWSGWNGTRFTRSRVVSRGPNRFESYNGIAVGPDHRIYVGIGLADGKTSDYAHSPGPYANSFVAVDPRTGKLELLATGIRQPWQPIFVPGLPGPLVSDLGQENLGKRRPPDRLLLITPGSDFGFPECPAKPKACTSYAKPWATFPAHASPVGLAATGRRVYVGLFGGTGRGPVVVSMPAKGGAYRPFLTGFAAPVVAVGAHAGQLYAGDLTGQIYRVKP